MVLVPLPDFYCGRTSALDPARGWTAPPTSSRGASEERCRRELTPTSRPPGSATSSSSPASLGVAGDALWAGRVEGLARGPSWAGFTLPRPQIPASRSPGRIGRRPPASLPLAAPFPALSLFSSSSEKPAQRATPPILAPGLQPPWRRWKGGTLSLSHRDPGFVLALDKPSRLTCLRPFAQQ